MMQKKYFFLLIVLFTSLFSLQAAEKKESASDILLKSRSLTADIQAIALLEKNIDKAESLKPWYILELCSRSIKLGNWVQAITWAEKQNLNDVPEEIKDSFLWWYAEALRLGNRIPQAQKILLERIQSGKTSMPSLYLAYFRIGDREASDSLNRFDTSFPQLKYTDPETFFLSRYLAGLCAVREADWLFAKFVFNTFLDIPQNSLKEYKGWASWYSAYSLYRLGQYKESIAAYSSFLKNYPLHPYGWQAAMTAALASLQSSENVFEFINQALSLAPNETSFAETAVLQATILMDTKNYDEASKVLNGIADGTSTRGQTALSSRALFMLGEIAAKNRNPEQAENYWLSLVSQFPKDTLSEEAVFRAGENWYIEGNLPKAISLFTRYRQTWVSGKYLDLVLRNGGEAQSKMGDIDFSILWWEDLIRKFPESPSLPRAYNELIQAYKKKHEYEAAIWTAQNYTMKFPKEASIDDIPSEIKLLTRLKNGENPDNTSLYVDFTRANRALTASGRALGLRLARNYYENYSTRSNAEPILQEIISEIPSNTDRLSGPEKNTFAAAYSMLGTIHREQGNNKIASSDFLKAGTLYASTDVERASESLYGAIDCFLQLGLLSDAQSSVEMLESSWPDSIWTRRARLLFDARFQAKKGKQ